MAEKRRFDSEIAVVTGGTRGIGRAVTERFAAEGATTIALYHADERAASETETALDEFEAQTSVEQCDVSEFDAVCATFEGITEEYGRPTILVNNAGRMDNGLLVRMDPEQWESVLDTNLTGAFNCTREAARYMLRGEGGAIVNVASVAGLRGWAGQANYAASKAGLIGFTRSVARELGDRSIRVNAVAPGYVDTKLYQDQISETAGVQAESVAEPEEIAEVITFLASGAASNVTGSVYRVDDGLIG